MFVQFLPRGFLVRASIARMAQGSKDVLPLNSSRFEVMFPNEIWMKIFKNIGRQKLMELRLVCHNFYDLIEDLLNKDPKWKDMTNDAILFECLTLTMQKAYPYDLVTFWNDITDPVMWRGTYLSYKKWQKVLVNPVTQRTIVPDFIFLGISCVCTFDKYIAIAFDNGSIANYTIEDISQPFYLIHQDSKIDQIEFWYSDGKLLVVTVGQEDCVLRFWDLQSKEEISTRGLFANSISGGECRHLCIAEMDGILTSYERVENRIIAGATINLELQETEVAVAHTIDGRNMTALAYNNYSTKMYLYHGIIEGTKLTRFQLDQIKDSVVLPPYLKFALRRLVMPTITFFFGIGENRIGSTNYYEDEWHEYNLVQHFGCHIRSMTLHAQILMFGLDDGSVHLLYIEHYGDVMALEDKIRDARKIQVDNEPIVDITVLEVNKKPCIVAITKKKVHLLDFF